MKNIPERAITAEPSKAPVDPNTEIPPEVPCAIGFRFKILYVFVLLNVPISVAHVSGQTADNDAT